MSIDGKPSITPDRESSRAAQISIQNIRQRIEKIESAVNTLDSSSIGSANTVATINSNLSAISARISTLEVQIESASSGETFVRVAAEALGTFVAVQEQTDGTVRAIDPTDPERCFYCIGVTESSVPTGGTVTLRRFGKITVASASWNVNYPVYANSDGTLTQNPPDTGTVVPVGIAVNSTDVDIQLQDTVLIDRDDFSIDDKFTPVSRQAAVVEWYLNSSLVGKRRIINITDGNGLTLTASDNPTGDRVDFQTQVDLGPGVIGVLPVVHGGTGLSTFTLGDIVYSDAADSLAKLSGNITATRKFLRQVGNGVASAAPAWDTLQSGDIPALAYVTSVDVSGGSTGLTFSGGPITSSGTITLSGTLGIASGGTGQTTASGAINALVPTQTGNSGKFLTTNGTAVSWATVTGGTVTSVALSDASGAPIYSISGSPVTTSGTLTFTLATQSANRVFAGPTTGSAAQPTFRALVAADIPSLSGTYALTGAITSSGLTQATSKLLGRTTASTGAIEEISIGTSLSFSSGSLNAIQDIRTSASPTFAGLTANGLISAATGAVAISGSEFSAFTMTSPTYPTGFFAGLNGIGEVDLNNRENKKINFLTNATLRISISNGGAVTFPSISTTASAANAFLDNAASNNLLRSTSSSRYKKNIRPLPVEQAKKILLMQPVTYQSTADADDPNLTWYGLVAENVASVDDRLVNWSYAPEDMEAIVQEEEFDDGNGKKIKYKTKRGFKPKPGAQLVPDGVQYERFVAHLLAIVKDQESRLTALENATPQVSKTKNGSK